MKKLMIIQSVLVLFAITSCSNNQQQADNVNINTVVTDSMTAFDSFYEQFSKLSAFAITEVSGRKVLLVSQETFGKDEIVDLEATEASIFALDEDGKIVALGSIRSQGTLYPVSSLDGKLMVAGHHFVKVYSIRGDLPELVIDNYAEGEDSELNELFMTFEKGTPVKFERWNMMR